MADAPRGLADVITGMRNDLADSLFASGVVTAFTPYACSVDMLGSVTAWPYLHTYAPTIGDVVLLAGSPGSWTVLGGLNASSLGSGGGGGSPGVHGHSEADVSGLAADLAGKASTVHAHAEGDVTGLAADLAGKAAASHTHAQSDVTGLAASLAGKAATSHVHAGTDITTGTVDVARLPVGVTGGIASYDDPRITGGSATDGVVRAALFGGSGRTTPYLCEYQLTTVYTALPGGDYTMSGNCTAVSDADSMLSTVSGAYRITIPVTGRYDIEWAWNVTSASGLVATGKVLKNYNTAQTAAQRATNSSILSGTAANIANDGVQVRIRETVRLTAADYIGFNVYCNGVGGTPVFTMPVTIFNGVRTRFCVRYVGP